MFWSRNPNIPNWPEQPKPFNYTIIIGILAATLLSSLAKDCSKWRSNKSIMNNYYLPEPTKKVEKSKERELLVVMIENKIMYMSFNNVECKDELVKNFINNLLWPNKEISLWKIKDKVKELTANMSDKEIKDLVRRMYKE